MFELVMTVAGKRETYSFDSGAAMEELYERMTIKKANKPKKKKGKPSNKKGSKKSHRVLGCIIILCNSNKP